MPGVSMCATDIAIGGTAGISGCGAAFKVDGLPESVLPRALQWFQ